MSELRTETLTKWAQIIESPPLEINQKEDQMYVYNNIYKRDKNPEWARKRLFDYAKTHSCSETARHFGCHINKEWVR